MNAAWDGRSRRALRCAGDDRGQALVEFALVVPLLLLLVLGVVEFGRAWHSYQVVTDAAREGARVAVVNNTSANVESMVEQSIRAALSNAGLDPNKAVIDPLDVGGNTGTPATIGVEYPYQLTFLRPLLGWTLQDASIALRTRFVMRNE